MTTIEPSPDAVAATSADAPSGDDVGSSPGRLLTAIVNWLTSTDHKIIGRLFIAGGVLGLLGTIAVNIVLAIERTDGASIVTDGDALAQLVDAQRLGFVFGTAVPLVTGLCLAVVPMQLGARSLAFARLAAFGFWLWLGGIVMSVVALARDGGTLGGDSDMVDLYIASLALMALGAVAAAVALGTTVLTTRAPGMTMRRVPFFSWSALVYALSLVLVMPVLFGMLVYLFIDHRNARAGFGGNVGILDWAGWIFTQPATFVFAIPVIGLLAELLPMALGKRLSARGIMYGGITLIGVSALAAITQVGTFNLPWSGSGLSIGDADDLEQKVRDAVPFASFNLLPVLGVLIVFGAGLALAKPAKDEHGDRARPTFTSAMVFAFLGAEMVFVAMIASMLYAIDDLGLQGTVFEEGVIVALVYGIALGVMGGVLHWSPKLTGHMIPGAKVAPIILLGAAGAVLASVPYFIAGFLDQPSLFVGGGLYDDSDLTIWNILVLVGHALMALAALGFAGLVLGARRSEDDDLEDDPWHGQTLEWITSSPAPDDNFIEVPVVHSAEPVLDLVTASPREGEA
jgi:heme/copper-type cytochrome/quinol oxidase subunit 1